MIVIISVFLLCFASLKNELIWISSTSLFLFLFFLKALATSLGILPCVVCMKFELCFILLFIFHPFNKHCIDLIKDAKVLQELPSTIPTISHLGSTFSWLLCFCHTVHLLVTQTSHVFSCLWTSVHVVSSDDFTSFSALFWVADSLIPRNLSKRPSLTIFSYSSFHFVLYYRVLFDFFIAFVLLWIVKNDFLFSCFSHYRTIPYRQGPFCLI